MKRQTTKNYAGRQVDIELLKHVEKMLPTQRVYANIPLDKDSDSDRNSDIKSVRIVSGIEKAVQRYTKIFLTTLESVRLDKSIGNTLYQSIRSGTISDLASLDGLYSLANMNALEAIIADDNDTETYGDIPDDERIISTELEDLNIDYSTGTVKIHIYLETASGDNFTFVIPIDSGIK